MQLIYGSIALLCVCVLTFNSVSARSVRVYADEDDSRSSEMERRDLHEALVDALIARSSRNFVRGGARKRQGGSGSGDFSSGLGSGLEAIGDLFSGSGSGLEALGDLFSGSGSGWDGLSSLLNVFGSGSGSGSGKRRRFNTGAGEKRQKQYYNKRNYDGGYNGDLDD